MDVRRTVDTLDKMQVRVHCLALGGVDLTSAAGRMTMGVIASVAEFEKDLLIERTHAGLKRAKAEGKHLGRPRSLDPQRCAEVTQRLEAGESVSSVARALCTSRQSIIRVRKRAEQASPTSA
jgi:putative DNA-invertase from lambdoid prophage Rac